LFAVISVMGPCSVLTALGLIDPTSSVRVFVTVAGFITRPTMETSAMIAGNSARTP